MTFILLSKYRNKTTPNDFLLCPQINAMLNPHQRRFFLQLMGVNTEPNSQTFILSKISVGQMLGRLLITNCLELCTDLLRKLY